MSTVLIVDDDAAVRELIADTLALAGHEVVVTTGGVEALAAIARDVPDCVVLDVMMPGMSGLDVLDRVRQDPATHTLPVLMLTARVDDVSTWQGWKAGADVYLQKPFDPTHLVSWVDRITARRAGLAQRRGADSDLRRLMMDELHLLAS